VIRLPPSWLPEQKLRVVHVAGAVDAASFRNGLRRLEVAGASVEHDGSLGNGPGYLAADDEARTADLLAALQDPGVGAILAARGGYGTMRVLEKLPADLQRNARWICGFSDITALHLWAATRGMPSIHGPVVTSLALDPNPDAAAALLRFLQQPLAPRTWSGLRCLHPGKARGRLLGGNLALVSALVGTPHCPDLRGAILFLEDVGEPLYRLDRMLTTLRMALGDARPSAVVFGQFTRCGNLSEWDFDEWLDAQTAAWKCPVVAGFPAGHEHPNCPFVLGFPYELDAQAGVLRTSFEGILDLFDGTEHAPLPPRTAIAAQPSKVSKSTVSPEAIWHGLQPLLEDAYASGVASALQLHVSLGESVVFDHAVGTTAHAGGDAHVEPVTAGTRFDIASVTKAMCTATLAALALHRGKVTLNDRCPADLSAAEPTLRQLLEHTSGLPAHVAVFEAVRDQLPPGASPTDASLQLARQLFASMPASHEPGVTVYSDIGFVALGRWLERVFGTSLDQAFASEIARPLGLSDTGFGPVSQQHVAATEFCPWRRRTLQGLVHDENAQVLGGICGHAGLFSTAADVGAFARATLGLAPRPGVMPLPELAAALQNIWDTGAQTTSGYVGGWDIPSSRASLAGDGQTRFQTFGHLGFTGTSVWIDRERQLVIALLTNRVHPTRDNALIRVWRPRIHNAVLRTLGF
jgi:serine-type D-Ala-D-Ala carboxypeptidase